MLKANKKTLVLASVVTVLPVLAGLLLWDRLPDEMATHFGLGGADGYSGKAAAVFGLPLLLLAVEWALALILSKDPKKQNISPRLAAMSLWLVPLVSLACAAAVYAHNLGYRTDAAFTAALLVGVLLIIIGNYLPKARQNYTVGVKLPWTLANEENWNRTHRLAGFLWVAGGILAVVAALAGVASVKRLLALFLVLALVPAVYSFWLHAARGL